MAREIMFSLNISADEILRYYKGAASVVTTTSIDGRSIRFPASRLRPFMTSTGINGLFAIRFDDENKFIDMRKVS